MRPRPLALILFLLPCAAVACQLVWSYDDYHDQPATTSSSVSAGSAGSGGSTTSSAGSGGSGGAASTTSSSTSGGCVDAGDPCDCDGDGERANTAECGFDGGDCDDHDPLVSSKQKQWFYAPAPKGWDYDCSNTFEYEHTGPISCAGLVVCDATPQFLGDPPFCGEAGAYAVCFAGGVLGQCIPSKQKGFLVQGCH